MPNLRKIARFFLDMVQVCNQKIYKDVANVLLLCVSFCQIWLKYSYGSLPFWQHHKNNKKRTHNIRGNAI